MILRHLQTAGNLLLAVLGMLLRGRIRGREQQAGPAADARPVAPPAAGPTERVTLYVANDAAEFCAQGADIPLPQPASNAPKNFCAPCWISTSPKTRRTRWARVRKYAPFIS
jgi:hypothetical protein